MPSKYRSVRTKVDGHSFASKAEARRYTELRLLEKAGEIESLELQPVFELRVPFMFGQLSRAIKAKVNGGSLVIGKYIGDFRYHDFKRGSVVEDVKGFDTPLSKWKRKHVAAQYGITVEIVH